MLLKHTAVHVRHACSTGVPHVLLSATRQGHSVLRMPALASGPRLQSWLGKQATTLKTVQAAPLSQILTDGMQPLLKQDLRTSSLTYTARKAAICQTASSGQSASACCIRGMGPSTSCTLSCRWTNIICTSLIRLSAHALTDCNAHECPAVTVGPM